MSKIISLLRSKTFKKRPFNTIVNIFYLLVSIIFSINPKIKINLGDIKILYKIFNIRTKNFGGRGLIIYREFIEDLFLSAPKIIGKKKNVIIDGGANFGMYSILFGKLNLNNQIYCIEPFKDYNYVINYNSKLNKIKNIKIINKVLSDKISDYKLNIKLGNTSASITRNLNATNYINIKSTTIDLVVQHYKIKQVDFVKLDIEGAEFLALKGAKKTIKNFKPKIVLECSTKNDFLNIKKFFFKFKYQPYIYDIDENKFILQKSFKKYYTNLFFLQKKHLEFTDLNE